jgi:hypothetical protein
MQPQDLRRQVQLDVATTLDDIASDGARRGGRGGSSEPAGHGSYFAAAAGSGMVTTLASSHEEPWRMSVLMYRPLPAIAPVVV